MIPARTLTVKVIPLRCVLFAFVLLPACYAAQKQKLLIEDFRTEDVTVPLTLANVTVADGRTAVEARPLKVHATGQQHTDSVHPPLSGAHTAAIRAELARYFTSGQKPVNVHVELIKGRQWFEGTSTRAKEGAEVEFKLTFTDAESGNTLFQGWGKSNPEVESNSASQAFSDALYVRGIEAGLYAAMRGIRHDVKF